MLFLVVYLFCLVLAVAIAARAALSDFRGMVIPNVFVVALPVVFFMAYGAAHFAGADAVFMQMSSHLYAALLAFVITFIMFAAKVMGAGDAKLITAFSFWFSLKYVLVFLFYLAFAGGVLGCVALYIKNKKPFKSPPKGSWIARLQAGEAIVPYGIAISVGAVLAFIRAGYFSPETLTLFFGG